MMSYNRKRMIFMNNITDLGSINKGSWAVIESACTSHMEKRLKDLGFIAGTPVKCVGINPGKNMKAFLVRGVIIALRIKDCRHIRVREC